MKFADDTQWSGGIGPQEPHHRMTFQILSEEWYITDKEQINQSSALAVERLTGCPLNRLQ